MLATDDDAIVDAYRSFGWALGIAFQLNDDLLGIWGDERRPARSRPIIATHKKTLPVIYATGARGPATDRARLKEMLRDAVTLDGPRSTKRAQILERTGARDYITRPERARAYRDEALARSVGRRRRRRGARRLRLIVVSAYQRLARSAPPRAAGRRFTRAPSGLRPPRRRRRPPSGRLTTSTLPTRRPSVVSTVSVSPSTSTVSPTLRTPPTRW